VIVGEFTANLVGSVVSLVGFMVGSFEGDDVG
jgi:hypothetical protein